MIEEKRWNELIKVHPIKKGDFFQITPGTVHAIKGGTVILETQQNSDITYRLYDYDRLSNGKPRQLHVAESLKSIDFDLPVPESRPTVDCPFFHFRAVESAGSIDVPASAETFTALFIVNERRSVLVPANCAASIPCTGTVLVTTL